MGTPLSDESFYSVMRRLESSQRWDLILRVAHDRLAIDPDDTDAHGWSGLAALRSGDLTAAETHAGELQTRNPDEPWTFQLIAELRFKQQRYDEALSHLQQALARWPNNPKFHQMLIAVHVAHRNETAAAAAAQETLQQDPANLPARFMALVLKYRFAYRSDVALKFLAELQALLSEDPQHAAILTAIGEAHIFRLGSPACAIPYLEQALASNPNHVPAQQFYDLARRLAAAPAVTHAAASSPVESHDAVCSDHFGAIDAVPWSQDGLVGESIDCLAAPGSLTGSPLAVMASAADGNADSPSFAQLCESDPPQFVHYLSGRVQLTTR